MTAKRIWSDAALKIIRDNHAIKSNREVAEMLCDAGFDFATENRVANAASKLGLKKNKTMVALRISKRVKKSSAVHNQIMSALTALGDAVNKFKDLPQEPVFEEETDEEYYDSLMADCVQDDDENILRNSGKRY